MSAGCPKNKWLPFIPKKMEDTLKENLSTYLSKYRLITDAIDIVDAKIIIDNIYFDP